MKKAAKLLAILLALGMILSLGACGFTNQMSPGALFGVESIQPSAVSSQKVLRDGMLYIVRPDGKTYNAQGAEVR